MVNSMNFLLIFLGGGLGSMARYAISSHSLFRFEQSYITGIILVNIIGSFLVGVLAGLGFRNHEIISPLLMMGFLGGFTTFSSFSLEAVHIFSSGKYLDGALYVLSSVVFSLLGTVIGLKLLAN
jgi:CrcB protein